jgi:hypothetical protein
MNTRTFSREVRNETLIKQHFHCFCCNEHNNLTFHHIIPNTKLFQKLYGDLIQSVLNCKAVCPKHHSNHSWDIELKHNLMSDFKFELTLIGEWKGKT